MKKTSLQSVNSDLFTQLDTEALNAVGGSTVFMTEKLTFVTPKIIDRIFDERTDL
ncbi:MAG TPA: hypothetical protein VEZ90_17895 [Blastocatellia bacterium]|nr:hypothetical protein [Blastocatellia bacterium]